MRSPSFSAVLSLAVFSSCVLVAAADEPQTRRYEQKVTEGSSDPVYLGYDNTDDYTSNRQFAALLPGGAVGIAFAVFGLVFCIVQIIGRCGKGRLQNRYCQLYCCTGGANPRGYTKKMRGLYVGWIAGCLCCYIFAACISMISSQPNLESGMNDLMTKLSAECEFMQEKTTDLIRTLTILEQPLHAPQMTAATDRVCTGIDQTKSDLADGFGLAGYLLTVVWVCLCVGPVCGIISWAVGRGNGCVVMVVHGWLALIISWLAFGYAYYTATWMDDTCVQMQLWYDCKSPVYFYQPNEWVTGGKCSKEQLTLATSGALSNKEPMCPSFSNSSASNSSAGSATASTTNFYEESFSESWWVLHDAIKDFHLLFPQGPSFGIQFPIPGSDEDPIYCQKSPSGAYQGPTMGLQGSSCVYAGNATFYNNITALRKLMYDTEGAHYDSVVKNCSTLWNVSTASTCSGAHCSEATGNTASADHDFSHFRVKDPVTYSYDCISGTDSDVVGPYCSESEADLFAHHGKVKQTLPIHCHEKAILTAADAMWESSWLASCSYLTNAAEQILVVEGPCDMVGDAFVYSFFAWGFSGVTSLIMILVGYLGMHAFEKCNYAENIHHDSKLESGPGAGFNKPTALEVEMKDDLDTKDETDKEPSAVIQDAI